MEPTMVTEHIKNLQDIQCIGKDTGYSFPVTGNEVVVNASKIDSMEPNTASNKVKVSQIAKVDWEERYYYGNLVSCNSTFVAYIIKGKGDKEDHVRVINYQTSTRLLLRGPKNKVVDICFESFDSNQLACIDSEGTLHIYRIIEKDGIIKSNLIIKIYRQNVADEEKQHVTWAPMLPMNTHESMVALSNGNSAEIYDLKRILEICQLEEESNEDDSNITALNREFDRNDIMEGVKILKDCHTKTITCLALSPDTKVLVTCSEDGDVKFWTVKFDDPDPSNCLHEWEPHGGEPVTSLKFCDNLLASDDTVSFWRYLITGTNMSSVLKIWCAVEWECLQTIEFAPYTDQIPTSSPCMKLALDISAKFLIVADIHRPVLYICHLSQDIEKEKTTIVSVSEFILKEPLLSFSIFTAKDRKGFLKSDESHDMINGDADNDESVDIDEGGEMKIVTSVTLFAIQKNSVQKLSIKYNANLSKDTSCPSISTAASSQEDLTSLRDGLSDIESAETCSEKQSVLESVDASLMSHLNESIDSSITAVSTVTVNGNHDDDDDLDCDEEDAEVSAINKMNDSATTYSSLATSVTDSFADTILSVNVTNDNVVGSIDPVVNGLNSLSLDTSIPPISVAALESKLSVIDEPGKAADRCNSAPCDEREAIYPDSSVQQGQVQQPAISGTPTTEQLMTLLSNQQQVLNNQHQVLVNQQKELKDVKEMLKQLLSKQHESVKYSSETAEKDQEDLKVYMQLLQKSTTSQLNKANKEFSKLCTEKLDQFLSSMNSVVQQKQEQNLSSLQGIVSNTISIKLEKTIKQEMKQTVTTSLEKLHSKYMDGINNQIAQKLSIWERTLREDTKELMKSSALVEAIGGSAANILQGTIPNSYTECFTKILLPGFEKALVTLFQQVDKTFRKGTGEYLDNVNKHLDAKSQKQQDARDPLLGHLQELVQSFQATADRLTSGVETNLEALMQKQLRDSMDKMQSNFCKTVENRITPSLSESISLSVTEAMEDFKKKLTDTLAEGLYHAPSSQQVSPEQESKDRKERINQLVQGGNINQAFEEALTASDLSLVMFLCRQVEPNGLFQATENAIPQPIILSLIQQLSVNLCEETERKRRYLEESIMALNKDDEITREHLPAVLDALNNQLSITIDTMVHSDLMNEQLKPLKMLLMASKSLLHGA